MSGARPPSRVRNSERVSAPAEDEMPIGLAAAIIQLDGSNSRAAMAGWNRMSNRAHRRVSRYLDRGQPGWTRRRRYRRVIRQLVRVAQTLT